MFFRNVLFFGLLLGVSSVPEPDTFRLLVDLFNALFVDSNVVLEYEFGSGVPLLNGKATITVTAPLELLPNSSVSYPDIYTQLCSMDVKVVKDIVISQQNRPDLVLTGCQVELDVVVRNRSDWRIKPILVWVYDCSTIEYSTGTAPPIPEQILPTLSQGLYNTAVELLSKDFDESEDIKSDPGQNLKTMQDMFPIFMYLKGRPIVVQKEDED